MNKTDLVDQLADKENLTKKKARSAIDTITQQITESLSKGDGEKVTIRGFGTFDVSHHDSREGVDPQDPDKRIQIPARMVPQFRPGNNLKEAVKEAHKNDE